MLQAILLLLAWLLFASALAIMIGNRVRDAEPQGPTAQTLSRVALRSGKSRTRLCILVALNADTHRAQQEHKDDHARHEP